MQLSLLDVKKVHLNARCDEEWWVELADECEERGTYAKLSRWLYLVRKAAWAWEDDNALKLTLHRSRRCRTAPAAFFHPETQVTVVWHGDDFTCAGTKSGLGKNEESQTVQPAAMRVEKPHLGGGRGGLGSR